MRYEPTREAAMAAFAKSWRGELFWQRRGGQPRRDIHGRVRLIVPARAGGGYDIVARLMSQFVGEPRPAIRRREPAGRGHQYGYRNGRACARGQLHVPLGPKPPMKMGTSP